MSSTKQLEDWLAGENDSKEDVKIKNLKTYEVSVRKRVSCEETAFKIVNKLIDGTVADTYLIECSKLITREHYDDIVEERALGLLCGYPLCGNPLGKILKQKYFISTRSNKVFDITERKSFCSNQCFKASTHFKGQISEAPTWGRGYEPSEEVFLLSRASNKGAVGQEVICIDPKKALEDEVAELQRLPENERNPIKQKITKTPKSILKTPKHEKENNSHHQQKEISTQSTNSSNTEREDEDLTEATLKFLKTDNASVNLLSETLGRCSLNRENDNTSSYKNVKGDGSETKPECEKLGSKTKDVTNTLSKLEINKKCEVSQNKIKYVHDKSKDISLNESQSKPIVNPSQSEADIKLHRLKELMAKKKSVLSNMIEVETIELKNPIVSKSQIQEFEMGEKKLENSKSKPVKDSNKKGEKQRKTKKCKEQLSPFAMITATLKRWITLQTVDYLKSWNMPEPSTPASFKDPKVRMGYAQLCRRLDRNEKEMDAFVDKVVGGEEEDASLEALIDEPSPVSSGPPKGHVPDYHKLREETEAFTDKVMEFYTGKRAEVKERIKKNVETADIYIPPVDSFNQQQIRAKIVLERLDKSIGDLLSALGLAVQEVSDYLRELCHTFNFEKDTIVFKPWEWTIVAMFVMRILSKKLPLVARCFKKDSAIMFFTTVLGGVGLTLDDLDLQVTDLLTMPETYEVKADGSIGMSGQDFLE